MGFNWIDLLILAILLLFIISAYKRSFISEFLDLLSFLTAFFLSFAFYSILGNFLESRFNIAHGVSLAFGFIVIWSLSELIFYILAPAIFKPFIRLQHKLPILNSFSTIPAILRGIIFIALILVVTLTLPVRVDVKRAIQASQISSYIIKAALKLESPVKQVFGGVSSDTLTFLTVKPKTDETINLGFQTTDFSPDEETENKMIDLVNKERKSRGLKTLTYDKDLRSLARNHSGDMLTRGYFSHFTPEGKDIAQRADEAKIYYSTIGENLAYAPSLELAHNGLMNSPGHKANILSPDFYKIGVGVMDAKVYGMMFTQIFSD